jgi:hypothetical protein
METLATRYFPSMFWLSFSELAEPREVALQEESSVLAAVTALVQRYQA